ncbi:MAG: caspase family protein [Verrucomicrobiota bacterium]
MKRKAILIDSSNVTGLHDLPGARVDVANWRNFLKSDLGGAWEDSEIITLIKPQSSEVNGHLAVDADCYSFVAYSGHGSDGSVVLNEGWINAGYSISNLKPKGSKGTLIIDSCRGVAEAKTYEFTKTALANASGRAVALNASRGREVIFANERELSERLILNRAGYVIKPRQKWEESAKGSLTGIVQMLACSKGQAAEEDPKAGGYYTSLLMQSADLWQILAAAGSIHTTKDAHDYAAFRLPAQQTPEYTPAGLTFPFAVKT